MPGIGQLFIRLGLNLDALRNAGAQVEKALAPTAAKLERIGSQLSLKLTTPLVLIGRQALNTAATFDGLRRGLTAVTGSAEEADRQMRRLKEVAKLPGLNFEDAIRGSINLQAVGFSATQAERTLKAFGNALATVGKGSEDLQGVNLALTQIISKGKVSAEEINQLAERVPQVRKAIEAAFGTADTEALQRQGIAAEQFVEGLITELEKLPKAASGIGNSLENAQQSIQDAFKAIGDAIIPVAERILNTAVPIIENLTRSFQALSPATQNFIVVAGLLVAALGPVAFVLSTVVSTAGLVVAAIAAVAGAAALIYQNWGGIAAFFGRLWDNVSTIFSTSIGLLVEHVRGLFLKAVETSVKGASKLLGLFTVIAAGLKDTTLIGLIGGVQEAIGGLVDEEGIADNKAKLKDLGGSFTAAFRDINAQGLETAGSVAAGFVKAVNVIKGAASGIGNLLSGTGLPSPPDADGQGAAGGDGSGTGSTTAARAPLAIPDFKGLAPKALDLQVNLPDTTAATASMEQFGEMQRRVTAEGFAFLDQQNLLSEQQNLLSEQGQLTYNALSIALDGVSAAIGDAFVRLVTFQGGLDGMAQTVRDFGRAFGDVIKQVVRDLTAAIAKAAILQGLLKLTGFGAAGTGGIFGSVLRGLAGRADGGPVKAGQTYVVGERGPEIFTPSVSGKIIPNDKLAEALAPATRLLAGFRAMGGSVFAGASYLVGERGPEVYTTMSRGERNVQSARQEVDLRVRLSRIRSEEFVLAVEESQSRSSRRFGTS